MSTFAQDTFTRANQSGWGTASGGGTWTSFAGTGTQSIASNEGHVTGVSAADVAYYLGTGTITDVDEVCRMTCSAYNNDATGIYGRVVDTGDWYRCMLGSGQLAFDKKVGGTFTGSFAFATATLTNNTYYWVHFRIQGSTLQARYWQDGTSEPSSWLVTATDTAVTAAGHVGVGAYVNATADTVNFDNFTASTLTTTSSQSVTESNPVIESVTTKQVIVQSVVESNPITETVSTMLYMISIQSVTETNVVSESVSTMSVSPPAPGTPGGVRLLINDVYYPTIRQESIGIDGSISNNPIPTFKVLIQDDPSNIAISELQEVVFIDASQIPNPTHNLLRNPIISPYATNWTATTTSGGTFTQVSPGVQLTASNVGASFGLSQNTQNGLIVAGQTYMLSCWVQSMLTNLNAYLSITYLTANGTVLSSQSLTLGSSASAQYSLSLTAPTGSVFAQVSFGLQQTNTTNSGTCTFWNIQFEPMSFTTGIAQQYYPSAFCANGQPSCTLMPDGTTIRQYRLFGGYVTKATAGRYIGNNRQWSLQVSGYAWLLQKQILNDSATNQTDKAILLTLIAKYFPNQFNTSMIVAGSTWDVFAYAYNGTMQDAVTAFCGNSGFYLYVDAYRNMIYQPPGYNMLGFQLSDKPDDATSFEYYSYSLDIDGTQLGNACIVTGATNISAIEYDAQSIGHYNLLTNGQGIFWRSVSDSTIASTAAARQRAIAEIAQYGYAIKTVHLTTNQPMVPGYSILFTSSTDDLIEVPLLIQKASIVLKGFKSVGNPTYEYACDLGAWQPDGVNITVKLLRKQLTNSNSIGTPTIGLMVTESTTFVDNIIIKQVPPMPANYGVGIYGTSTYAFAVPGIPTTKYGIGVYGNAGYGYN